MNHSMELVIDAADDEPGIALAIEGVVHAAQTWRSERKHSVELLPNIDRLMRDAGVDKHDLTAVCVDIGPGGYAALRVGVSIAKAIAHVLAIPLAGVGRLELDAWRARRARPLRMIAAHRAGRGELAWAAYALGPGPGDVRELVAPRITGAAALIETLSAGDALTGDVDPALASAAVAAGAAIAGAEGHRVFALASLGHARLAAGRTDDPTTLVPLYLRAPAIGPQPQR